MSSVENWRRFLTTDAISKASGGRIQPLSEQAAAGFMGNLAIESGRPDLSAADVVEHGSGAGRGIIQATGPRRKAYDHARNEAIARGVDPNSDQFQQQYIVDEYLGKYDKLAGGSLSGYTGTFDADSPVRNMNAEQAAEYFSKQYFRPGIPHNDRRRQAALGFASGKVPAAAVARGGGAAGDEGGGGEAPAPSTPSFATRLAQQLLEQSATPMASAAAGSGYGSPRLAQALMDLQAPRPIQQPQQAPQRSPWEGLFGGPAKPPPQQEPGPGMLDEEPRRGGRRFAGESLMDLATLAGYG